jgi:adenylyltransferase/sulfurtransferase
MNKKIKYGAVIVIAAIIALFIGAQQTVNSDTAIPAKEARIQLAKDSTIVLLDVRTPNEHLTERIADTPLIPLQELEQRIHELDSYKDQTIIVYCRSGNRSGSAVRILRERGFKALNMLGGINQWKAEQFPTITGPTK